MQIVYVDGFKIRNTLDDDFAELHRNLGKFSIFANKYYIPENEIWIDDIYRKSEEVNFFLKVDLESERYFNDPNLIKDETENTNKSVDQWYWRKWLNEKICLPGQVPDFVVKRETLDEDLSVVYVNGVIIRKYLDCQFVYGGHDLVYSYIPKNEIWLDVVNGETENKYILIHEKLERDLMAQGKIYDIAHRYALVADMEARINDGIGMYVGDANYVWSSLTNEEIINKYYVIKRSGKIK